MHVENIHERSLNASSEQVGKLIDSLASRHDLLWPHNSWPPMKFDRPLSIGAIGGHGPIRYLVETYLPGQSVSFRFLGPKGFDGYHCFEILNTSNDNTVLRHTLRMAIRGRAIVTWPLIFRPMHNALIEDSLACAEASMGLPSTVLPWSLWVRLLRWVISGGRVRRQMTPNRSIQGGEPR